MKKSKSYKEKESDALFAQEPELLYHLSHDTNAGLSHKKEISKVDFPGQFTEQEKKSRLKAAIETTIGFLQNEVKAMVATWKK